MKMVDAGKTHKCINLENIYPRQDQFGSRRNSSINHEVIELVDKILDATENNGIFYFLIGRTHLTRYVIINNCLKVDLYLARRKQSVKCNVDETLYNVESRKHLLFIPSYS